MGFTNCTVLSEINLPDTITTIGDYAFQNCDSLEIIDNLPDTITSLGKDPFWQCDSLTKIIIPKGIENLSGIAGSCPKISEIVFQEGLKSINIPCMTYWSPSARLKKITIPSTVETIGYAFFTDEVEEVYFVDPNGWSRGIESMGVSYSSVSADLLSDPKTAASTVKEKSSRGWTYEYKKN